MSRLLEKGMKVNKRGAFIKNRRMINESFHFLVNDENFS